MADDPVHPPPSAPITARGTCCCCCRSWFRSSIYIAILVTILWLPHALGGWGAVFDAADQKFIAAKRGSLLLSSGSHLLYITLAFGSALALFLYPHSVTGVLASKNRDVIKRNMAALPAYTPLLGLIARLGFMAIAAKGQGSSSSAR